MPQEAHVVSSSTGHTPGCYKCCAEAIPSWLPHGWPKGKSGLASSPDEHSSTFVSSALQWTTVMHFIHQKSIFVALKHVCNSDTTWKGNTLIQQSALRLPKAAMPNFQEGFGLGALSKVNRN